MTSSCSKAELFACRPYRSVGHDAVDERRRTGSSTRPSLPAPTPIGPGGACT